MTAPQRCLFCGATIAADGPRFVNRETGAVCCAYQSGSGEHKLAPCPRQIAEPEEWDFVGLIHGDA